MIGVPTLLALRRLLRIEQMVRDSAVWLGEARVVVDMEAVR
jgi:hypothetical protein